MADSIIDALVVTLGLDSSKFEDGVNKAGASVVGLGKKLAGMFIAVRGAEDVFNYFKDLSKELAQLSFTAQNLDLRATELSRWGEVAQLAGGQASDAAASFQSLTSAVMGLRFQGQMSPQLMALQRLGVSYMNANGTRRDPGAVATDLATVLQRAFPNDQAARYYWAQQAGEQGGMATAVAEGPAAVAKMLSTAIKDQKSLTEKAIDSQVQLYQGVVSLTNTVRANSADLLSQVTPALNELVSELRDISKIIDAIAHPVKFIEDTGKKTFGQGSTLWSLLGLNAPRGIRNNNPTNLKATGNQARDAQGFAIFPTMQEGIEAAENQLDIYGSRGLNTISQIISKWAPPGKNDTAAYIKFVSGYLHKSPNAALTGADYPTLIAAMSQLESRWKISASDVNSMLAPPNVSAAARGIISRPPPSPGVARSSGGSAASNTTSMAGGTTVNFESVVINSQAPNGTGIATDFVAAVRRKMLVANADVGLA